MRRTFVPITGIVVTGLLIGYYLYLNKHVHVAKPQLFELVEKSYASNNESTVREIINRKLEGLNGDFKIVGWETKKIDEQTLLASYTYKKDGRTQGWFFDVKSGGRIIRDVSLDQELMKKYNVAFKAVFTAADNAQMHDLMKKSFGMIGLEYKESLFADIVPGPDACKTLPPSEQEVFRKLRIKRMGHNGRILIRNQGTPYLFNAVK